VTEAEVEVRYVMPTSPTGEKAPFSHLRSLYRTRPPAHQEADRRQPRVPFR
jgi:hypothetical protein